MSKTFWIIGAVVVVGIGLAAGLIFAGGKEPQAAIVPPTSGSGMDTPAAIAIAPQASAAVVAVQVPSQPAPVSTNQAVVVPPSSGEQDEVIVLASIDELFANATQYARKDVILRGTIVTQCIAGCTFSLEDGTGVVGVELIDDALDHVLSGGSVGRRVEVHGTVETSPQLVIVIEEPDGWKYLN